MPSPMYPFPMRIKTLAILVAVFFLTCLIGIALLDEPDSYPERIAYEVPLSDMNAYEMAVHSIETEVE